MAAAIHELDIISRVELAIIARLKAGLGRMVMSVESYGGELEIETVAEAVRRFPAAWVTFGGVKDTKPHSNSKDRWRSAGSFVVMVGARNVRNEAASRRGGAGKGEIGSYQLVTAVRRLLIRQDLGLPIDHFEPGRVRTLFNTAVERQAFSVFACEFHTVWMEGALENGHWPEMDAPGADSLFSAYQGQTERAGVLTSVQLHYHLQPDVDGKHDAQDIVRTQEPHP